MLHELIRPIVRAVKLPVSLDALLARRRVVAGLAALVVVAAALVGYAIWPSEHAKPPRHTPSPVALAPIPTLSEPAPTPTPTPPPVRRSSHEFVRAAAPTSFTLTGRR